VSTSRIETLRKFIEDDPTDPFAHYAIAIEYVSMNDHAAAIDALEHIIRQFPSYVPAYQQLGILLHQAGNNGKARGILERGIVAAGKAGEHHAQSEMQDLLDEIDDEA
jgi:tetratricopeptide (TPR) repeat protein